MSVVSVTFSICPGCVPQVKSAVFMALGRADAPAGLLSTHLAEVGEVNTLCCFFDCPDACACLLQIQHWLDGIQASAAGESLRYVECVLHHCEASPAQWRQMAEAARVALVQRVFRSADVSNEPGSVLLHPLTGPHGLTWCLTPVASHDAALTLCQLSTLNPAAPLRDSVMWIPAN